MRSRLRTRSSPRSCARAWPPQPQISAVLLFVRARYLAATAVAAAVRSAVIDIESMTARGCPVTASHRTTTPWMVGSPCRGPLCGKFGNRTRHEVGPVEGEERRLDVEAAILDMQAEDSRRRRLTERVLAESVLDRCDACIGREKALDVAARKQQRADGAGPGIRDKGGNGCSLIARTPSPQGGPGAALGTEMVCLGPGGLLGNPARLKPKDRPGAYNLRELYKERCDDFNTYVEEPRAAINRPPARSQ